MPNPFKAATPRLYAATSLPASAAFRYQEFAVTALAGTPMPLAYLCASSTWASILPALASWVSCDKGRSARSDAADSSAEATQAMARMETSTQEVASPHRQA